MLGAIIGDLIYSSYRSGKSNSKRLLSVESRLSDYTLAMVSVMQTITSNPNAQRGEFLDSVRTQFEMLGGTYPMPSSVVIPTSFYSPKAGVWLLSHFDFGSEYQTVSELLQRVYSRSTIPMLGFYQLTLTENTRNFCVLEQISESSNFLEASQKTAKMDNFAACFGGILAEIIFGIPTSIRRDAYQHIPLEYISIVNNFNKQYLQKLK